MPDLSQTDQARFSVDQDAPPPLVSVITIFLDQISFLAEAIDSVLDQTYENWELILIDDGSTDGSSGIARAYAARHPGQIRYFTHSEHANRGASASRNLGFHHAKGKYVAFLDGDDLFLPGKLTEQVSMLEAMPNVGMLYGRTYLWYGWTGNPADAARDKLTQAARWLNRLYAPPELAIQFLENESLYPCTCSVLIRSDAIREVDGCDERFRLTHDDLVLFLKICMRYPVYVSERCWDRYRRHDNSTWARVQRSEDYRVGRPNRIRKALLDWGENHMREVGLEGTSAWTVLQRELAPYRSALMWAPLRALSRMRWEGKQLAKQVARRLLSDETRGKVKRTFSHWPPRGAVRFGSLRRLRPISRWWGFDRGTPIDRHYIEDFLTQYRRDIHGHVLEIGEDRYATRFGGTAVRKLDILHVSETDPQATIVADLADPVSAIPSNTFDVVIVTQTIHLIYDIQACVRTLHRILRPGGVALVTVPGIGDARRDPASGAPVYWFLTPDSAECLFGDVFSPENVVSAARGNVLTATAFLYGVAAEELSGHELSYNDPEYPVSVSVRAVKV
jgi:glycosyltransferase involved in cell wall biosynthesis